MKKLKEIILILIQTDFRLQGKLMIYFNKSSQTINAWVKNQSPELLSINALEIIAQHAIENNIDGCTTGIDSLLTITQYYETQNEQIKTIS